MIGKAKRARAVEAFFLAAVLVSSGTAAPARNKDKKKDPNEIGNRDVGKGVNLFNFEKEIALGKQMAQEVEQRAKIVEDPVIAEYVNRVGQNLVRNSDAKVPFTIKVVDSDEVNAFALPGGFFFVDSALILAAHDEAELAGVMAHEIAHVAARHGTRQATRGEIANYATLPLIFMGGWAGYAIEGAASAIVPLGFLKFSRGFETEADMLGLQYLYKTGYDPTAFVDFFERLEATEKTKPGTFAKVFATHPMTEDRIKATQLYLQQNLEPRPEYVLDTSEFQEVKSRLEMMQNHRKPKDDNSRPRLRRAPGNGGDTEADDGAPAKGDQDERPTLKRRN